MDRKSLLGLSVAALIVLVIAVVVVAGGGAGQGPAASAQGFFAAIPSGGPQAAYDKASPAFRSATSADAWASTAAQHNLTQYARSSWTSSGEGGGVVTLNGVLTLKSGGVQPATVRMIKGDKGWSVYSLDLPNGGVTGGSAPVAVASAAGAGAAGAPPVDSGQDGAAPPAPSGAPGGDSYGAGAPPPQSPPEAAPPQAVSPQPAYPPSGYAQGGPPQGAPMLVPGRLAHDCGPQILRLPGVYNVDIHCTNGVNAMAGVGGQCQAMVNGHPATVHFVVQSYDPARDDAELSCRLY